MSDIGDKPMHDSARPGSAAGTRAIAGAVFTVDRDWRYTFISEGFEPLVGKPAAELLGRNVWEVFPESESEARPLYERAFAENSAVAFRRYYEPQDAWFDVRAFPSATGLGVIITPASTEAELERQLELEREQLRRSLELQRQLAGQLEEERLLLQEAIDNANAHIAYLDRDFNFVLVNDTYAQGSGHTIEELLGKNHFELFPNEENVAIFSRARDTGTVVEFRGKPFEFADQPWRGVTYWDWRLTPVKDAGGRVNGLVLSLVDVTEERVGARINEALAMIEQSIHATLDRDEMLRRVAEQSATAIGAHSTVLAMLEADRWVVRYASNMPEAVMGQGFSQADAPFMGIAADLRRPVAIDDAMNDPRANPATQKYLGVRSVMMAPLVVRDEVLGGLFFNYFHPHEFKRQEIEYATRLSASIGLAIANIGLYEAEHDIATRLQDALLSLPEEVPGVEFAHVYHSAEDVARVGGDFYDLFEIEHDKVGVVIGDVAGKGLDAAVITSLVKNTIRAHAYTPGRSPADILALTDAIVNRETPPEVFATVLFGVLDLQTGDFEYCNAGHAAGALLGCGSCPSKLESNSPLLGTLEGAVFRDDHVRLGEGHVLLLYTDGLTEARRDGEFYGEDALFGLLSSAQPQSAGEVVDAVLSDVVQFASGRLQDDLAMLALRRTLR